MTGTAVVASPAGRRWQAARWPIRLLAVFAVLGSLLAVTTTAATAATAADDFNRANGALGASWTKISDGALTISGQAVAGTSASANSGDLWTASTFTGNQFSQITTSTQLTGGQWVGVAVRANSTGQQAYVGIYYWNNGTPDMRLYRRNGSSWTQLGNVYSSGALPVGTQIQLSAVGSTISLLTNGTARITATDSTLTAGAPGIITFGKSTADNWTGGDVTAAPTYSVGGSVSGLSGSVVLADNGGRQPDGVGERVVHVRDQAGLGGGVRGDGEDQPVGSDVLGGQRVGDDRVGQRHQRRRDVCCGQPHVLGGWRRCRGCRAVWCWLTTAGTT